MDKIGAASFLLWGAAAGAWGTYLFWVRPHLAQDAQSASVTQQRSTPALPNPPGALRRGTILPGVGVYDPSPSTVQAAKPYGHFITINQPAHSKEACLSETNGIINEDFVRCRNGGPTPVWVNADGSTEPIPANLAR